MLPDPTVLAPLLAPYGASTDIDRHRRAHYAAMAVKSHHNHGEHDWSAYNDAYVRSVGVGDDVSRRGSRCARARAGLLSCGAGRSLSRCVACACSHDRGVPLGVVSNASGQIAATLSGAGICQIGDGAGVGVRCIVDSHVVGRRQARSGDLRPCRPRVRRDRSVPDRLRRRLGDDRRRRGDRRRVCSPCSSTPTTITSAPRSSASGKSPTCSRSRATFVQNKTRTTVTKWVVCRP